LGDTVIIRNSLIKGLELEYIDDWSKDLLLDDFCCRADFNDCRLDIIAWACYLFTSAKDATALSHDFLKAFFIFAKAVSVVHRAHQGTFSHRVSNFNCCVCFYHSGNESIINRLMEIDPS